MTDEAHHDGGTISTGASLSLTDCRYRYRKFLRYDMENSYVTI